MSATLRYDTPNWGIVLSEHTSILHKIAHQRCCGFAFDKENRERGITVWTSFRGVFPAPPLKGPLGEWAFLFLSVFPSIVSWGTPQTNQLDYPVNRIGVKGQVRSRTLLLTAFKSGGVLEKFTT